MTAPARFSKADVRRAIQSVEEAGCPITGVRIEPDGSITVMTGKVANDRGNSLDRLHG